jgi:hypothetical protein
LEASQKTGLVRIVEITVVFPQRPGFCVQQVKGKGVSRFFPRLFYQALDKDTASIPCAWLLDTLVMTETPAVIAVLTALFWFSCSEMLFNL